MTRIVYIGLKQQKADSVADTKLVWERGQIHEISDPKVAAKFLEHKDIWADADKPYKLMEPEDIKPPAPVVTITVPGARFEIGQSAEVVSGIARGEYVAVFMTKAEKQAFDEFKALEEFKKVEPPHTTKKSKAPLQAEM